MDNVPPPVQRSLFLKSIFSTRILWHSILADSKQQMCLILGRNHAHVDIQARKCCERFIIFHSFVDQAVHRHRKDIRMIPARGPIYKFFRFRLEFRHVYV